MRNLTRAMLAAGLLMLGLATADAAAIQGKVVATCGGRSYNVGSDVAIDMLQTGQLCSAATFSGNVNAVGPDAAGSAASGNPVRVGALYETSPATVTTGRVANLHSSASGILYVNLASTDGTTQTTVATAAADGQATSIAGLATNSRLYLYNGSTFDRAPGTTLGAYGIIRDAGGNARGANVTAASTSAVLADTGLVVSPSPNPSTVCTGVTPINQTSSTDVKTFTAKGHICAILLVSATAQNISVIEGTGSICATSPTALIGGTTASLPVGVNGGFSAVSERAWVQTQVTGDHLCILQSGSGNVSGIITWQDHT